MDLEQDKWKNGLENNSDAIILDLGLNIEEIGNQYPKAHLIASADIRQGYINSGFLIFKNCNYIPDQLLNFVLIIIIIQICKKIRKFLI